MAYTPPVIVTEAVKRYDEAKKHHDLFVRRYERGERSYRGVLETASQAAQWRHQYTPKYAFNLIETIVSNLTEMGLRFDVRPSPHAKMPLQEAMQMADQVDVISDLLRHEHRLDEMEFKQRSLFLSAAIGGIGVGKTYWNYTTGPRTRQKVTSKPIHDENGNHLIDVPVIGEETTMQVTRDHSTFEVIDPRDFILHESAKTLQPLEPGGAQYLFHRCWYSYEQLKMMESGGFVKDVAALKDNAISFEQEYRDRETELWNVNRTKDLIEVLEYWKFEDGVVKRALVGNRAVLLRDLESSPFRHGEYPFIISSSMPALFSTKGFSDIELIEQLQEILWELGNQRLDNVELINNWITLVRTDVDDPEAFQFYPGAQWPVESPGQVETLAPPYQLTQVSLEAEALIKGDLQNVSGAAPLTGGMTAGMDQKTATGASMVMNAAQQRMEMKKYLAQRGLRHEANQRIKNCQQFISDDYLVHVLGEDGKTTFREIDPVAIQGDFIAELEPIGESSMRQERRAESIQKTQVLLQAAPLAAAAGAPLNIKEILSDFLSKGWGQEDVDRFFSVQPQSAGAMGGPPGGPGGPPGGAPGLGIAPPGAGPPANPLGSMGITAGSAVDASKPSAAGGVSGSPVMALQRAMAMSGRNR